MPEGIISREMSLRGESRRRRLRSKIHSGIGEIAIYKKPPNRPDPREK